MKNKSAVAWAAAAALFCLLLIGYFALSGAGQATGSHPHDKANHHPRSTGDGPSN
jgi:hypothetical protein